MEIEITKSKKELLLQFFNDHLITNRKKFIIKSNRTNTYRTVFKPLTDNIIKYHLDGKSTVGLFAGELATKFMVLDVDVANDLNSAQKITLDILSFLENTYGVEDDNAFVTYSGCKGYHIYVLFDDMMSNKVVESAYRKLLIGLNLTSSQVELRPKDNLGVKLPFGYHPVTKAYCCLVNPYNNFEEISELGVTEKTPTNREDFTTMVNTYKIEAIKKQEYYKEMTRISRANRKQILAEKLVPKLKLIDCKEILTQNRLLETNSRHNSTLMLAIYCKYLNYTEDKAVEKISDIIENTYSNYRNLISSRVTKQKALSEVTRLVHLTYTKNYKFNASNLNVVITESEFRTIFSLNSKIRDIAFYLLIHSKRYQPLNADGEFSMSYRQLLDYGLNTTFKYIYEAYVELEDLGLIQVTNREILNSQTSYKDTTKFKVLFRDTLQPFTGVLGESVSNTSEPTENGLESLETPLESKLMRINLSVLTADDLNVDKLGLLMLGENEVKNYYPRTTFYRKIKKFAEAVTTIVGADLVSEEELFNEISDILSEKDSRKAEEKAEILKQKLIQFIKEKQTETEVRDTLQIAEIISGILLYKKIRIELLVQQTNSIGNMAS